MLARDNFRHSRKERGRLLGRRQRATGDAVTEIQARDLITALDEAPLSRFHLRAVLASGMGFFTDAYDLFVIGIASALITKDWNLSSGKLACSTPRCCLPRSSAPSSSAASPT